MNIREEAEKMLRGKIKFLEDIDFPPLLKTHVVCSPIYAGTFEIESVPPLPDGYFFVSAKDIPGSNALSCFNGNMPVLPLNEIMYQGEPLCVFIGEDEATLAALAEETSIRYDEDTPLLSIEHPDEEVITDRFSVTKGDVHTVFRENRNIIEGEYSIQYQEYQFLEPQSGVGLFEDKHITIYCPTRNAFHVRDNIISLLNLPETRITVIVPDSVQDPGDKEALPMLISSLTALCTFITKQNVRITLNNAIRRYPTIIKHRTAVSDDGKLLATKVSLVTDCGAYPSTSPHLFFRSIYTILGAYRFETYEIEAVTVKTNKIPFTRFLNGGAVEAFFGIELHMTNTARLIGENPASFKMKNLQTVRYTKKQSDTENNPAIIRLIRTVTEQSDFDRKFRSYEALRGKVPFPHFQHPIRGIGFAVSYFGFDFIDEPRHNEKHAVGLDFEKNTLTIYTSATEMGQGLKHLFTRIAAQTLDLKPEQVKIAPIDTSVVPDSGPIYETHAVTEIGKLIEDGCKKLRKKIGKSKKPVSVLHTVRRKKPAVRQQLFSKTDADKLSWAAMVIEIEIDPATLDVSIDGIWTAIESGNIIDEEIARIHIEKEIASGLETLCYSSFPHGHKKRVYKKMPPISISFAEQHFPGGPAGGKGIGELPSLPVAPAYIAAVSQAINHDIHFFPFSAMHLEDIVETE